MLGVWWGWAAARSEHTNVHPSPPPAYPARCARAPFVPRKGQFCQVAIMSPYQAFIIFGHAVFKNRAQTFCPRYAKQPY